MQGRHPLQTSDALGAANVQLGPEALTLSAHLNKEMGLSHERVARILKWSYGLEMSRSGICRALERIGKKAAPTYQQLCVLIQRSDQTWLAWTYMGAISDRVLPPDQGFMAYAPDRSRTIDHT